MKIEIGLTLRQLEFALENARAVVSKITPFPEDQDTSNYVLTVTVGNEFTNDYIQSISYFDIQRNVTYYNYSTINK